MVITGINISLHLFKHITTSATESHIQDMLMVLKCIEVLTSYRHDCKKDIDMLNTSNQFTYTMRFLWFIASIKMVPDEVQCYCKCRRKKAILLYTLYTSYMDYELLEECIHACFWIQSGFSSGC